MSNAQAARDQQQQPPIDPKLQNKLITKFGKTLMRQGFTALPQLVQRYYRHVPGNALFDYDYERDTETKTWAKKPDTQRVVCDVSHMTPTEYALMTAIWSYWWSGNSEPWPSVDHLCEQLDKSDRQVRRYLQRLRDKGFMLSIEQFNFEGKQISNRYDFSPFLRKLVDYLDALEQLQKQAQDISKNAQNDRERVSEVAGRRVSEVAPKTNRSSDTDSFNIDKSNSSGSAATLKGRGLSPDETYSHIEPSTIRNGTEDTEETNSSKNETSNRTQPPYEQGAAEYANDVDKEYREETSTRFETSSEQGAAAAGIPREHLEGLGQETRKRPDVPFFIEACIDDVSRQLNDSQPNSSITQAHNIYSFYAGQFEEFGEEQFRKHLYIALKRANHLSDGDVAIRHKGKANKMPAFFGSFKASLRREYGVEPLKGSRQTSGTSEGAAASPSSENNVDASVSTSNETTQGSDHREEQFHSNRVQKVSRTSEQKENRHHYAEHVRNQLRHYGVIGSLDMIVDREHGCGCPLYHGNWKCVRCRPDQRWEQDVLALIDTIMEH